MRTKHQLPPKKPSPATTKLTLKELFLLYLIREMATGFMIDWPNTSESIPKMYQPSFISEKVLTSMCSTEKVLPLTKLLLLLVESNLDKFNNF